jgi:hypothetical protein
MMHHGEALHHDGQHVFAADQATVKEREAGAGHEQNERGADQHPAIVCSRLCLGDLRLELGELIGCHGGLRKGDAAGKHCENKENPAETRTHVTPKDGCSRLPVCRGIVRQGSILLDYTEAGRRGPVASNTVDLLLHGLRKIENRKKA